MYYSFQIAARMLRQWHFTDALMITKRAPGKGTYQEARQKN
jgi:hypothetical protein